MTVYNISPHRSGTQSVHSFCCAHGVNSKHWCGHEWESRIADQFAGYRELGDFAQRPTTFRIALDAYYRVGDVFSDFPTPAVYRAMLEDADAKFILVTRDADSWVRSVRRLKGETRLTFFERYFYFDITGEWALLLTDYTDEQLSYGYRFYVGRVLRDFVGMRERLLVVDLKEPTIGAQISKFIGFSQGFSFPAEGAF